MRVLTAVIVAASLFVSIPARAGIEVSGAKTQRFDSPMMLTLDFPLSDSSKWGKGKWASGSDYSTLPYYICNDVNLRKLHVSVELLKKNGEARVSFEGVLGAAPGDDKEVTLTIDLMKGDAVIASATEDGIKVEEKKENDWDTHLEVDPSQLREEPAPKVRITMTVVDL